MASAGCPDVGGGAGDELGCPPDALPPPEQEAATSAAAATVQTRSERATIPGYVRNGRRLHATSIVVEARARHLTAVVEGKQRRQAPHALMRRVRSSTVALARRRHG